jgi:hypothetical protein
MLLDEVLGLLKGYSPTQAIQRYCIGERYCGVLLNKEAGIAYTPADVMTSFELDFDIAGFDAMRIAQWALNSDILKRTIGIATINALSWTIIPQHYRFYVTDPLEAIDIKDRIVAMIGYFPPLVEQFSPIVKEPRVIERKDMEGTYWPEDAEAVMSDADIVIITGSALIYGGMEKYLECSKNADEVIVLGPTASMLPDPFFKRGATIVGGIQILDADTIFDIISRSGGARDLGDSARKIYFMKADG